MKTPKALLPIIVAAIIGMPTTSYGKEKLPTAEVVIKKFVNVTGGLKKYKSITSEVSKGKCLIMGHSFAIESKRTTSGKLALKIDMGSRGSQSSFSNGKAYWSMSTMGGARLVEGKEADQLRDDISFEKDYAPAKFYKSMKTVGVETIGGETCYRVELIKNGGSKSHHFYSKKSGLLLRKVAPTVIENMGTVAITTIFSDYKDVDGLKVAHTTTIKLPNGLTQVIKLSEIKHNVKIPESTFAVPAEIQKMIDKKKKTKAVE